MILKIIGACAPILVALVGIIPSIVANRKKTEESIGKLQKTLDDHIREDEEADVRNRRYRILRFHDEICEGRHHSESHFEDILEDIDAYEKYCSTHPTFRNSRGHSAMEHIKETYRLIKINGGFLSREERKGA